MKKFLYLCLFLCVILRIDAKTLTIDGKSYQVDTIANFIAGPGTQYIQLRLTSDSRLDVYFLKVDTSNPYVSFKAALGRDSIYGGERPSAVAARKSIPGAVYFAGTNADFYNVSDYIGYPLAGCVVDNEVAKIPNSERRIIAFEADKLPVIGVMSYAGQVKFGEQVWTLDGVNHLREADQLILYNQYNGKVTRTNATGTEVLVKLKTGESWGVSKTITAVVEAVYQNKGGTPIPKGYAVLSGHGTAAAKLNTLSVNDEIQLTLDMEMGGRKYAVSQMVGGDGRRPMLDEGVIETSQVWNELHPRTAIGYSEDKQIVTFGVVDGRGVSVGVTTKQLAQLMVSAGCYTAFNMDGGGSTCMYIKEFGPVNEFSDPSERAVGNSLFAVSSAPESSSIAFIQPHNPGVTLNITDTHKPVFISYNQYGNILNKNLTGVVLSCPPTLGTISNGTFIPSGKGSGIINAQYGSVSTKIRVDVVDPEEFQEITVFSDGFNRTELSPGGTPSVTYSVLKTGTANPAIESYLLKLPIVTGENARTQVMAATTNFTSPYNSVLSSIDGDSVVWTFNMRHNYNGRLTGIDDAASRGIATIIAATSSDVSTASGYAVINGGASPINYRLVKFTNGITNASNITVLQHGQTLVENRLYMSIKVVYIPATNTWKMYDRIDNETVATGSFLYPVDETNPYKLAGTITDDTFTQTALGYFGFSHKYSGTLAFNFWADNFGVRVFKSKKETSVDATKSDKNYKWRYVSGGIVIEAVSANAYLYDLQGVLLQSVKIQHQGEININKKGLYLLKMTTPDGKTNVEKILI